MNKQEKKFRKKHNITEVFSEGMYRILAKELKRHREINIINEKWFWNIW